MLSCLYDEMFVDVCRVKNKLKLQQTFTVDPLYLRHDNSDTTDFMVQTHVSIITCQSVRLFHCRSLTFISWFLQHWQIPLSRRFRSLKLWFVMRSFGLKNLQAHIRHVRVAIMNVNRLISENK